MVPSNPKSSKPIGRAYWALLTMTLCSLLGSLGSAGVCSAASTPDLEAQRAKLLAESQRLGDWQLGETEHFFLLTDVHGGGFIEELKLRLEAIQLVFETDFPPHLARHSARKTQAPKGLVRVFSRQPEYFDHGGPEGSAGFWSPARGELALHTQAGLAGLRQTWSTLNHEAFHQYIYFHLGEQTPHTWYGEGYGDFYGTYTMIDGKYIRPQTPDEHAELGAALHSGEYAGLRDFIHWTKGEYYGTNDMGLTSRLAYAQGYSLIRFLISGSEVFPQGWQDHWNNILPRYHRTFTQTGRPEQALSSAFDGINLIALENCWKHFLLTT